MLFSLDVPTKGIGPQEREKRVIIINGKPTVSDVPEQKERQSQETSRMDRTFIASHHCVCGLSFVTSAGIMAVFYKQRTRLSIP